MRHRAHGRKLGRTSSHRRAMFRNQLTALFTHERIITTVAKAKDLRPQAEKMVTLARTGTLANRRRILSSISDPDVVRRLFEDIAPRFADRPGGYTRIMRLGRRRGDGAELAIIEFVDYVPSEGEEAGGGGRRKPSLMDRAKGMFGAGAKAEAEGAEPDEEIAEEAAGDEVTSEVEAAPQPEMAEAAQDPAAEPAEEAAADEDEKKD